MPKKSETSCIETYLDVVSKRKSINRKHKTPQVNFAVVSQLEEKDIPLLIEMVRIQTRALEAVMQIQEDEESGQSASQPAHEEMAIVCAQAYVKATELAQTGSVAKWGDAGLH